MIQLKEILENMGGNLAQTLQQKPEQQPPQQMRHLTPEEKKKLMEMVGGYNNYNKTVFREGRLTDVARDLKEILRLTESYLVTESNDFVEANTAKRHIQEIRKYCDSFAKIAEEVEVKNRQLEALYKDVGARLENYFEIKDAEKTPVDPEK